MNHLIDKGGKLLKKIINKIATTVYLLYCLIVLLCYFLTPTTRTTLIILGLVLLSIFKYLNQKNIF